MKPWNVEHVAHYCGTYINAGSPPGSSVKTNIVKKIHIYYEMDFYVGYMSEGYTQDTEDLWKKTNFLVFAINDNKITLRLTEESADGKDIIKGKFVIRKSTGKGNPEKGLLIDSEFYKRISE